MLGSSCCCQCPSIIPYRQTNTWPYVEEYDIPQSVEVDISFDLPQDELTIETRKGCCPDAPPSSSTGLKYKRPVGGLYSLSPTGFPYMYEYVSRDLFMRAELSSQYFRDTQQNPLQTCLPWGSLEVRFGSSAYIGRSGLKPPSYMPAQPVTDAELTAALSGYTTFVAFVRYCSRSTRNFQNIANGGCVVGAWNELYQLPATGVFFGPQAIRLPQEYKVPFTANVYVPAQELTLGFLQAQDACYYFENAQTPCFTATNPGALDPQYVFPGTTLVSRTWQAANQGVSQLPGTLTINSAKAKRAGLPDIDVLDMPTP